MSRFISRRIFLKGLLAGSAGFLAGSCLPESGRKGGKLERPNVVLMLADDLGYGDLSCYGCPDIWTPNIDRLAGEGVYFTDAYASAPVCSPTRVALMTGVYQQRCGVRCEEYMGGGVAGLSPEEHRTLGMYLKDAGYQTVCFGKWNIGGGDENMISPMDHGFDHWVGMNHNHNYVSHRGYNERTKDWTGVLRMFVDRERKDVEGYTTDVLGNCAVDYISKVDLERPFFLYLAWQAPHSPLQAPDAEYASEEEIAKVPVHTAPEFRGAYCKIVERLDHQVGRVMGALKERGLDENTLVIFASDNGGCRSSRNLPLRGGKQELFEGGIRVPQIIRQPGRIDAGGRIEMPCITMDITATILAACGARADGELDGMDLMDYMTGEKEYDGGRTLYWRRRTYSGEPKVYVVANKAIRDGDWKYIRDNAGDKEYLFNLGEDLSEERNLVESEFEKAAELRGKLAEWEERVSADRDIL